MQPVPDIVWRTAPDHWDINPGTKHGRTLFMEITKGLSIDQRFDLTRSNGPLIHKYLRARESNFRAVTDTPIQWFTDGNIFRTANLLQQHHDVKMYDVQRAGHALFNKNFGADGPTGKGPYFTSALFPATDLEDRARFH